MKQYTVTWEIDIDANTPEEAAREALKIQRDTGSEATVFEVTDTSSEQTKTVDLFYLDEWELD